MMKQLSSGMLMAIAVTFSAALTSVGRADPPTNLATFGTATASSELGACCGSGTPFFASRAVDASRFGNSNTSIFHTNDPDLSASFSVNLGGEFYLDRIQIFPRENAVQNSVENFRIDVFDSSNANVFSQTYLAGDSTRDRVWGTVDVRNIQGQTVTLTRLDGSPSFMTFAEFEVFGSDKPIQQNLALGKSITTLSAPGFGSTNDDAIDGDINGHFFVADDSTIGGPGPVYHSSGTSGAGGAIDDQFWRVDLGEEVNIDYLNLYSRTDGVTTGPVLLEILEEDGTTVAHSQLLNLAGTDLGGFRFDQTVDLTNVSGQFVRLSATTTGEFLAFSELEVFAAVPEPASFILWSLGGLSLVGYAWRRVYKSR
jgi:hypothetical protein